MTYTSITKSPDWETVLFVRPQSFLFPIMSEFIDTLWNFLTLCPEGGGFDSLYCSKGGLYRLIVLGEGFCSLQVVSQGLSRRAWLLMKLNVTFMVRKLRQLFKIFKILIVPLFWLIIDDITVMLSLILLSWIFFANHLCTNSYFIPKFKIEFHLHG